MTASRVSQKFILMCTPSFKPLVLFALVVLGMIRLQAETASDSPSFALVGFATVKAYGLEKVTGGGNGPVIEVRTAQEFRDACERRDIKKKAQQHSSPRVVKVVADIDLGELANERGGEELKSVGKVELRSNTTVIAAGAGATIRHGILDVHGASNVIIRNLKFRDLWENDPTEKYDRYGWDYVRITSSGKQPSHHVWVDHCDFGKCYDGHLDITHGSDLVTVSWCHFSGDERGPHKKSMLIGHSSSPTAAAMDKGRLNVTLHHNWFENIADRAPRVRFGNLHAFNNFVDGAENATISVMKAVTLVENCVYKDTRVATTFSHAKDSVARNQGGTICIVNSRNIEPRAPNAEAVAASETEDIEDSAPAATPKPASQKEKDPNRELEVTNNFKSSVERAALQFNQPAGWTWENRNELPYTYKLDPLDEVRALVTKSAGTGKL